ncbi:hypothetical protein So717_17600 [Roseobacter cerasinus]|uniref:VWFA domain-containing protein n=1 Tax=Roseobacter cerasinus TaxID=2602289 RepID=A0A640VQH1_9RHOB|nr:Ig-like domain-containing protein [Roseobacter cerasinus]GFE50007.1 hypothetical protein So717_17600 [Roseobacter cerasinus]
MSLNHEAKDEETDDVVTLWGDAPEAVLVPDSALLFNGAFYRLGPDLYIVNDGAANYRIPDYFAGGEAVDLRDPNGAILRGDLVERLAGPIAPGQYAQAGTTSGAAPIGQVEAAQGEATVQRTDGTEELLEPGSPIYQNDVIVTAEDASLSVTFTDGTIFSLSASSRMVIDALIYDPAGTDNSGTFSLIQGGFVFIAGQVAKTGGMEVNTPSSTMGIRGTTVVVQIGTVNGVDTTEISLTSDPDGSTGRVEVRDVDGNLVATITDTDTKWIVSAASGETQEVPRSFADAAGDNLLIAEAFAAYRSTVGQTGGPDAPAAPGASPAPPQAPAEIEELDPDATPDGSDGVEAVPAPPPVETDQGTGDVEAPDSLDESLITPPVQDGSEEGPVIVVSGPEDAGEEGAISGSVDAIGGGAGTVFSLLDGPSNGAVVLGADGQFDYVPAPDFNGTDSFTFEAVVPGGETIEGTVVVEVLPVNDAPVADDQTASVEEDGVLVGQIAARDVDGDTLTYVLGDTPSSGEVALLPDGSYSYRPDADFFGTDSFTVLVSDPAGESAEATVSITVSPVNDAPVITTAPGGNRGTVVEDVAPSSVKGRLTAVDPDPGSTITWSGTSSALFGTFVISASGAWRYVLDNAAADELGAGETVVETMTATARDEFGAEVTQIIEVTVKGTNDAPTVAPNTVIEVPRDGTVEGQLAATDIDSTGPLNFALSGDGPAHGTVVIAADGSFTYTPAEGFVGIDRFSYSVTDEEGGVSTGQISAAVEGASDGAEVTVALTPQGGEVTAGVIEVETVPAAPVAINLVIAMDSSDSTGAAGWVAQREAVRDAVVSLAEQFDGSEVSVDVQIIQYADAARALQPFDLQDPALPQAILSLPFLEGATAWDQALDEANRFLATQPAGEENLMLFITEGLPPDGRWRSALKELTGSAGGSNLDIQAFALGGGDDLALLQQIDADPTFAATGADLAGAVTQAPVFSPRLIELDVTLEADGADKGSIADQDSMGFAEDGAGYELPLASIQNIEALLGESNRINVTARFDTDGNDATSEVEHFSSDLIGKAETAQNLSGQDGADLLFGSDAGDRIEGGAGDDVMLGFDGDDTLDGGAGDDVVLAGDGDDILRVADVPQIGELLDGGAGRDVLQIDLGGNVSDELIPVLELRDIEAIDLDNAQANTLEISLEDVIELSSTSDSELETLLDQALPESAVIYGDASDSLVLLSGEGGAFQKTSEAPVSDGKGNTLDIYSYIEGGNVLATLGVDTEIEVTGAVTVS